MTLVLVSLIINTAQTVVDLYRGYIVSSRSDLFASMVLGDFALDCMTGQERSTPAAALADRARYMLTPDVRAQLRQPARAASPERTLLRLAVSEPLPRSDHSSFPSSQDHALHLVLVILLASTGIAPRPNHLCSLHDPLDLVQFWSGDSRGSVGLEEWESVYAVQGGPV